MQIFHIGGKMACNYLAAIYWNLNGCSSHSLTPHRQAIAQLFVRGDLSVLALCKPPPHLVLSWATIVVCRVSAVSPSLGLEGPSPGGVMSPSYLRDPSVFAGSPVLLPYPVLTSANCCWQHDLSSCHTDGADA